ncbi:unnamed protein product, partial [Polarella glacialis]
ASRQSSEAKLRDLAAETNGLRSKVEALQAQNRSLVSDKEHLKRGDAERRLAEEDRRQAFEDSNEVLKARIAELEARVKLKDDGMKNQVYVAEARKRASVEHGLPILSMLKTLQATPSVFQGPERGGGRATSFEADLTGDSPPQRTEPIATQAVRPPRRSSLTQLVVDLRGEVGSPVMEEVVFEVPMTPEGQALPGRGGKSSPGKGNGKVRMFAPASE